ncbi:helix-turn-helix domain-containing protein [Saccharibacillus sp. CPCC 101409]|uniref:winged helix-turn-helix transcriptional regulator n=1 Tax=Saccharibacillus sp. CPCC 101409 TaxID=3058041 RepID=UPI0026729EE3|nr:helix-turn-helix domain-containing protein [Saccharibacillus sp. CPCC 101409]MDO3411561.1 helix-turn-helix domain-containing protein [Saccharibacillus sp. CPCC 101409]
MEPVKTYNTAVEATIEVIGGKWKPVILFVLTFGKKRNGELMKLLPAAVTQKVLTQQLKELERDGVIRRISHPTVPPRVEYELTDYGQSLKEILHAMCRWGELHVERAYGDRAAIVSPGSLLADNAADVISE